MVNDNLNFLKASLGKTKYQKLIQTYVRASFSKNPLIIFLHLPKCAGTTLNNIVNRQFQQRQIHEHLSRCTPEDAHNYFQIFNKMPYEVKLAYRFVPGHIPFGIHKYFLQPTTYITILRDPIERVISDYYFILRSKNHMYFSEVKTKGLSLLELLRKGIQHTLDNGQTRMLAGLEAMRRSYGQCDEEMLDNAIGNLNQFSVIGLTEHFDETLLLLKRKFKWESVFYQKSNVATNKPSQSDLDNETLEEIIKYNQFDLQLYQYAQKIFKRSLDSQDETFSTELKYFQVLNKYYSSIQDKENIIFNKLEKKYPLPIALGLYSIYQLKTEGNFIDSNFIAEVLISEHPSVSDILV